MRGKLGGIKVWQVGVVLITLLAVCTECAGRLRACRRGAIRQINQSPAVLAGVPCSFIILWAGKRQQYNFAMVRIQGVKAMESIEALKVGAGGVLGDDYGLLS